ncbi:polynucleotidyl transferase ribonuclease H fold, partial [Trifolium medium]|nr:polynucleotidyl transferase ribonuclease H fold [Trifolium medium]
WNDGPSLSNQVRRIAYDVWNDWFAIHHLKHDENHNFVPPTTGRWEKPCIGWVKCNVDAAFFVEARVTMKGACFRDLVGNFVADLTQRQHTTLSTMEGEAWTLLHAKKRKPIVEVWIWFNLKATHRS